MNFGSDEYFMKFAIEEAKIAYSEGEVPIGAVITVNNRIIGKAHNRTEALNDITAHAEMLAITSATENLGGKYLQQCTLYVTVEPCAMCAGALGWSQIKRIVYGVPDAKRGFQSYYNSDKTPLHKNTEITGGVLEKECKDLMQSFFKKLR